MAFGLRRIEPHEMGTGGVTHTLLQMAVPTIVAGLLATTFQVVDTLFISWLGPEPVSGVAMAFPVLFFIYAVGQAAGVGVATLASRLLGQKDEAGAKDVLDQALLVSFCVGGVFSLVAPLAVRPILVMLQTADAVMVYATDYLYLMMLSSVVMHLWLVADAGLRAQGNTVTGMRLAFFGNVLNLLLDGFFIFGPDNLPQGIPQAWGLRHLGDVYVEFGLDLGVQGAALTTVLSRFLVMVLMLAALWSSRSHVRPFVPWRTVPKFDGRLLWRIYELGFPATISIVGMSFSAAWINRLLVGFGATIPGAFLIAHRLEMFAFMPIFSIGGAVVPLVGYNLGAGMIRRCRRVILTSCLVSGVGMGAIGVVLFAFSRQCMAAFTNDPELLDAGSTYLRINSLSYFLIGVDVMLSNGFQGLSHPLLSTATQLLRAVFIKVPAAWLLSIPFGVTGIWLGSPASTFGCFCFAAVTMWWLLRRLRARYPEQSPPRQPEAGLQGGGQP